MRKPASVPVSRPKLLLGAEIACWVFAVGALGFVARNSWAAEDNLRRAGEIVTPKHVAQAGRGDPQTPPTEAPQSGSILGRMDIREAGLSVPVLEDDTSSILRHAVGHIPGTAYPGGLGNVGLAGHRDTLLRRLQYVKPHMKILIATRSGNFTYEVDTTEVVTPDKVSILEIGEVPQLTVVTCFPFYFVGSAPERFIVHAHLLSLIPE